MTTLKPSEPMLAHWRFCLAHGRPRLPIHAVAHTGAGLQPRSYIQAWSVHRAAAEQSAESIGTGVEIITFNPPGALA